MAFKFERRMYDAGRRAGMEIRMIGDRFAEGAIEGLKEAAQVTMDIAKDIAPKKSRDLVKSAKIVQKRKAEYLGNGKYDENPQFTIVFGDKLRYAAVHEYWPAPTYQNPTTPGTQPKFLRRARGTIIQAKTVETLVTRAVNRALAKRLKYPHTPHFGEMP